MLYPPESETRVANFCCFLGRFSRPIEIRVDHIAAFIELLIQFQRVLGFDQHPTRSERLRVWYTRVTTGAKLDGSEPLQFGFRQRLTIYLKQVLGRGALVIGGAIVVAIVVAVLNHIGLDNLANILRGKPL
ncbi:hypothetical protein [Bradyrhizobium centrosematis]|uniref:hypothetical protein n=1 Tax=Bradyrhizobium centrosematis TaxID=1300039 RepID=UPI003890D6FD